MEQELVKTEDTKEFNKALDTVTGFGGNVERLPVVKYSSVDGIFVRSDNDKDEEGKTIYPTELGKTIDLHIVNQAFQSVSSGDKSDVYVFSREYVGQTVELINGKDVIERGKYKELKEKYDIRYKKVLYAYLGEEMVRVFVSGYGLTNFFPYIQANGNPARYDTTFKQGERMKGEQGKDCVKASKEDIAQYEADLKAGKKPKLNLFYGLKFEKKDDVPQDIIIERVKGVNEYLLNKNKDTVLTAVPEEAKQVEEGQPTDKDLEDIPF